MIKKDYVFPYYIGDGIGFCARWEDDILSMTFLRYYIPDMPNVIEVKFHGVEWIRSTTLVKYPCSDEEWDVYCYSSDKPIDEYLLLEREWFNDDYEEFMSGNGSSLAGIRCLEDNVVFIDDVIIFSCTEIEIVSAKTVVNTDCVEEQLLKEYRKKYRS